MTRTKSTTSAHSKPTGQVIFFKIDYTTTGFSFTLT